MRLLNPLSKLLDNFVFFDFDIYFLRPIGFFNIASTLFFLNYNSSPVYVIISQCTSVKLCYRAIYYIFLKFLAASICRSAVSSSGFNNYKAKFLRFTLFVSSRSVDIFFNDVTIFSRRSSWKFNSSILDKKSSSTSS